MLGNESIHFNINYSELEGLIGTATSEKNGLMDYNFYNVGKRRVLEMTNIPICIGSIKNQSWSRGGLIVFGFNEASSFLYFIGAETRNLEKVQFKFNEILGLSDICFWYKEDAEHIKIYASNKSYVSGVVTVCSISHFMQTDASFIGEKELSSNLVEIQ